MRRRLAAAMLLTLPPLGGLTLAALAGPSHPGPVYSVAQVQSDLARRPSAWADRTLLLRGVADAAGCLVKQTRAVRVCAPPRAVLGDAAPTTPIAPLPLTWADPDPLLAAARRLPLLGDLLPAPQVPRWGAVATYRIRLQATPSGLCRAGVCYQALLLDAAP